MESSNKYFGYHGERSSPFDNSSIGLRCAEQLLMMHIMRCSLYSHKSSTRSAKTGLVITTEEDFNRTGEEWFLEFLTNAPAETRSLLLFLFWRVWHHQIT
jgi:hypothetical protein